MSKRAKVLGRAALALVVLLLGATFLSSVVFNGQEDMRTLECMRKLREIASSTVLYAELQGQVYLSHDPEGGVKVFQSIADRFGQESLPEVFICPHSDEEAPAERDASGRWIITDANTSYRWTTKRLKTTDRGPWILVYDKRPHPNGKRCAAFADGSVRELTKEEFRKAVEAQER